MEYQIIYADPPWHYENYSNQWVVLQRPFGKKSNRCLYSGESIEEALQALKGEA